LAKKNTGKWKKQKLHLQSNGRNEDEKLNNKNHYKEVETLLKSQMELRGTLQELMSIYHPEWCYRKRNEETLCGQVEIIKKKLQKGEQQGKIGTLPPVPQ